MKTLFIGGIKSGKSKNAEEYILKNSTSKPTYLATTEFIDKEMQERIDKHKLQRKNLFITIEEPIKLYEVIKTIKTPILIECISMWINNMLYYGQSYEEMQKELIKILELDINIVFILNDVGCGVIPDNKLAREFVDISGKLSQVIALNCEEVYHNIAGIATKIK